MTKNEMINSRAPRRMIAVMMLVAMLLSVIMPASTERAFAADGTISLKVGREIDYSGHFTNYFYAGDKDHLVYCAQPQLATPPSGTYSYSFLDYDSMIAKVLYYGYGGPGFEDYTDKKLSGTWDGDDDAYALTHVLVSLAYDKTTDADVEPFRHLSDTWKNKATSMYNYIKSLPDPPVNFRAYRIKIAGAQDILGAWCDTGTIKLKKSSSNTAMSGESSDYSLSGAKYGVYYNNQLCYTMTTDTNGSCTLDNVLVADYTVKEISAPKGFAVDTSSQNCSVKTDKTTELSATDVPKNNPVELMLQKGDSETGLAQPQGAAKLEGAVYEIKYFKNKNGSEVLDRTWRVVTDAEGKAMLKEEYLDKSFNNSEFYLSSNGNICLPLGSVTIQEVKAPEGYLLNDKIYSDQIKEGSETVETVSTFNAPEIGKNAEMAEQVKRGDIQLVKVKDGKMNRLANVQFRITSKTTGESHVVCTDENGMIDTQSSFNSHKNDTNGGDAECGLWFGIEEAIDDAKGALIYDYYYINELRGENNQGLTLAEDVEFRIYKDKAVVNLGTITDDIMKIRTTAVDSDTKNHVSMADNKVTIIDTVKYSNFVVGTRYNLVGTLMDKATETPIIVNGSQVTASKEFTPREEDGTVDVEFTFDGTGLAGTEVVVFEKAYSVDVESCTEEEVCSHEDITDAGQTVAIPRIGTKASTADGKTNVIKPAKDQKIIDTVSYEKLLSGVEYELTTWLTKDGKKIWGTEVTKKFTPTAADGEVKAELTFNASKHGNEELVVFEEISLNGKLVAEHKDKNDKDQMIKVDKPEEAKAVHSPQTGDNTRIKLLAGISLAALLTGAGLLIFGRRKEKDGDL